MRPNHRTSTVLSLVAVLALLGAGLTPDPAAAQRCANEGSQPSVCSIDLVYSVRGEDARAHVGADGVLRLRPGVTTVLSIRPEDQAGRGFPAQRFSYSIVAGNDCRGLIDVEEERTGEILIDTGNRTGSCELSILPANNANLDRRLRIEVVGATTGPVTTGPVTSPGNDDVVFSPRSEALAGWLYQAILGRDGEAAGLADAAARIQRGQVEEQIDLMLQSPEFQERRRGMTAAQLLDAFYQGLLGRAADPAGTRRYMNDMLQANFDDVLDELVESRELEERLTRAAGR
jgi:hypothetical protein